MSIQSSWLTKKFVVDSNIITAMNRFSLTRELKVRELQSKDGKNPVNVQGFEPMSLTTTHKVSHSAGSDPLKEFREWEALLGKRGGFHIEGRRIGPPALILDRVEFTANAISNTGVILDADITLTFSEDVNFAPAPKAAVELYVGESEIEGDAPGYQPNGTASKSAYNIRPNASAAEAKS